MAALRDLLVPGHPPLPAALLSVSFARSGGPGGQNVNKVASKADLRLDLEGARAVWGDGRVNRVRERLATRLDGDGRLVVMASEHREQGRNVDAALVRMERLLALALEREAPRVPTRPSRASKERRLKAKKLRGAVRRDRRIPED